MLVDFATFAAAVARRSGPVNAGPIRIDVKATARATVHGLDLDRSTVPAGRSATIYVSENGQWLLVGGGE